MTTGAPAGKAAAKRTDIAFLLAQLGALAAGQFGERAAALGFSRPQAGLLRLIGREAGLSQQAIAARLGTPASRLVALVGDLEARGLVKRQRNQQDRRNYALHLTGKGQDALRSLDAAAAEHEQSIAGPLTAAERRQLCGLLTRLAAGHQLQPGIHPGFRHLPAKSENGEPKDGRPG
ncbi:MAG TPA: MarR family transcriptional regulator [Streptosporangiaceae bacterium]